MGARIWNNAGNYDANVALVQKFYARTRCSNEENFQTSTLEHFPMRCAPVGAEKAADR
jgi:hypothetical protein